MKLQSIAKLLGAIGATTTFGSSFGSPTCECSKPPGGTIRCELGQIPSCIVRADGTVEGRCMTPPRSSARGDALRDWILSELLGPAFHAKSLSRMEFEKIMAKQEIHLPDGTIIRFRIPPELR